MLKIQSMPLSAGTNEPNITGPEYPEMPFWSHYARAICRVATQVPETTGRFRAFTIDFC